MFNILFLCTGNSCRSQMAEGYAKDIAPAGVHIYSAGIEKHGINPVALQVMEDVDISIQSQFSKTVDELDIDFDLIITLCDHADKTCPDFSGKRIHWSFFDPATVKGSEDEILSQFKAVRDLIFARITEYFNDTEF